MISASEKINSIQDRVWNPGAFVMVMTLRSCMNWAAGSLHQPFGISLVKNSLPLIKFKVQSQHLVSNLRILILTSENYHWSCENSCLVIFSGNYIYTSSLCHFPLSERGIVDQDLIRALPYLSLAIEHKAASKWYNATLVRHGNMVLSSFDWFVSLIGYVPPFSLVVLYLLSFQTFDSEHGNIFAGIESHPSNQVPMIVNWS